MNTDQPDEIKDFEYYSRELGLCWNKHTGGIFAMGRLLAEAKINLPLMAISESERLTNPENWKYLPPSWNKLYELNQLPDCVFEYAKASGLLHRA